MASTLGVEIVFDFRLADPVDLAGKTLAVVEPLLACFQRALGHELPNQLVSIQGLARLLLLDQADRLDDEGRDYLRRLADGVRLADELVRSLADLGRLLREPGPPVPLDLAELVVEVAAGMKVLFPDRQIEYHLGKNWPVLTMPPKPWLHVFTLLFRQALAATPTARPVCLDVNACHTADGVEVVVTDNGPSLNETELRQRFDPFGRGSEGLGQGLGLFPVRQIVASWAGVLRVQSGPTQGTTYRFSIPTL